MGAASPRRCGPFAVNVLVTGGSGYVGSHAAVELLGDGHDVVLMDNLSNSSRSAVGAVRAVAGRSVRFVCGDVRDAPLLDRLLIAHRFDAVMHFAAAKSVAESLNRPFHYYDNNLAGTLCLVDRMAAHGVKTLVFSSSAAVYGHAAEAPTPEDAPTAPTCPYGGSKLAAEQALRDVYAADRRWRISVLRYFNAAGVHPGGGLGENPRGEPRNLLPALARVAAGQSERLTVHGGDYPTRDGTSERDYPHVTDLARGHLAALEWLARGPRFGVHNLGTGRGHTVLEVVRAFEAVSGVAVPVRIAGRRPGDVAVSRADPRRAERELGWRAERGLAAACADLWRWRSNGGSIP